MNLLIALALVLLPSHTVAYEAPKEIIEEKVLTIDEMITQEFGASSIMHRVAHCESGNRQFYPSGEVIRGKVHSPDTGLFQINSNVWGDTAQKLNLDIETVEGNIKMARYILSTQGISAWDPSRSCWERV